MQTPLQVTFRNLATSEALEALIRDRVVRLERFHHRVTACRVVVEVPHRSAGSGKVPIGVAVEVDVPGRQLVARGEEQAHEAKGDRGIVVKRVFEAIERQLEEAARMDRRDVKPHLSEVETGRIARLFAEQGYGFVEVGGGPDLHFTATALANGLTMAELVPGQMVTVRRAVADGPMGPQASSIGKIGEAQKMRRG